MHSAILLFMKRYILLLFITLGFTSVTFAQIPPKTHPDTSGPGWVDLFKPNVSNAINTGGVWSVTDGVFTATEDQPLWSEKAYDNYILDLEFKNVEGTNSGVFLHASDTEDYVPNSVEVQIADDYAKEWAESPASWQAGAFFGHQAAARHVVKRPGEWNRYTITVIGDEIWVLLNGEQVNHMDMKQWTSATVNPDGTEIPEWLSQPVANLPLTGHIGFQGKHAGKPIYFRNIRIKELK